MPSFSSSANRDANRVPLQSPLPFFATKNIVFDGGTLNGIGDIDGTNNPATIFTVTGDVLLMPLGTIITPLVSTSGSISIGVEGNDIVFRSANGYGIFATAGGVITGGATDNPLLTAEWIFADTLVVGGGSDFIVTAATDNITAGELAFYAFWAPLSSDGNVVAA